GDINLAARSLRVDGKTGNRELPLRGLGLRAAELLVAQADDDGRLIPNVRTIAVTMRRIHSRYRSGVRLSAHVLRHTFATECVRAGVQPFDLATILGHSNIQQTMRYYHAHADRLAAAMVLSGQAHAPFPARLASGFHSRSATSRVSSQAASASRLTRRSPPMSNTRGNSWPSASCTSFLDSMWSQPATVRSGTRSVGITARSPPEPAQPPAAPCRASRDAPATR